MPSDQTAVECDEDKIERATQVSLVRNITSDFAPRRRTLLARFLSALGPGLITGAADDDPSGIATYSAAGALLGTTQLWSFGLR